MDGGGSRSRARKPLTARGSADCTGISAAKSAPEKCTVKKPNVSWRAAFQNAKQIRKTRPKFRTSFMHQENRMISRAFFWCKILEFCNAGYARSCPSRLLLEHFPARA
jgi:hypothetical protein